jgi:hypothetical protein
MLKRAKLILFVTFFTQVLAAQTSVWFFQDATNPGYYDTGLAFKTAPSFVEQTGVSGDKIPTNTQYVYQGNNSLKLRWTSQAGGDWSALVIAPGFAFQDIKGMDTLAFWVYAPTGLAKAAMPKIFMETAPGSSKTRKYNISDYSNNIPVATWTEVKIPLNIFTQDAANSALDFSKTKAIIFGQNAADGIEQTVYIDNVRAYKASASGNLLAPTNHNATSYENHIELTWNKGEGTPDAYQIWRSSDNGTTYTFLKTTADTQRIYVDYIGSDINTVNYKYKVKAVNGNSESPFSNEATGAKRAMTDDELLTMVQRYSFRYFWDFAHPTSGMARERNTSNNTVTTGGTGFGVMAFPVAIERGFIGRSEGVKQLLKIVRFLETADRFKGVFPHWMDGNTGKTIPFSNLDNGGDLVETSFLMQGLLTCKQYFDKTDADEVLLRQKITKLWEEVDWNWYRRNNSGVLYWHWSPNYDWQMNFPLYGYYEALITYVLAVASPTKNVPASVYQTGWTGRSSYRNGQTYYGYKLDVGPLAGGPLFFAHYSFLGFDPRNKRDAYTNYFTHNKNQSWVNWTFCKENPKQWAGYSGDSWGLTSSDDPNGYSAHEPLGNNDNGTISPTAALSSMPYTPTQSMAALKHFYKKEGAKLWGTMGFYDAFNPTKNWYASSYLAIDQGPIIAMIENHRTGLLWKLFMKNPEIKPALDAMGFVPDSTTAIKGPLSILDDFDLKIHPNPSFQTAPIDFDLKNKMNLDLEIVDMSGRVIKKVFQKRLFLEGENQISISIEGIEKGLYALILRGDNFIKQGKISILNN